MNRTLSRRFRGIRRVPLLLSSASPWREMHCSRAAAPLTFSAGQNSRINPKTLVGPVCNRSKPGFGIASSFGPVFRRDLHDLRDRLAACVAVIASLFTIISPAALRAQESDDVGDVARLVREGQVETLHERFRGGRTSEELRLLAFAQTNKAASADPGAARQEAFKDAEARFLAWIAVAENDPEYDRIQRKVHAGMARLAYAEMILSRWASNDLDEFELSAGKRGRPDRLINLLLKARDVLNRAAGVLQPMASELLDAGRRRDAEVEERYLIAGIFDAVPRLLLDVQYNRAWANLYVSLADSHNAARRSEALRSAEQDFRILVESEQVGPAATRCELGLAMTLREQARHEEARRLFDRVIGAETGFASNAQARYEAARNELKYGRFDEARALLLPLTKLDPLNLTPEQATARFYINLAALWEANSRLLEADYLERTAGKSAVGADLRTKASNARETGLLKMNDLASFGGEWPNIVRLYVNQAIDLDTDPELQSPAALLHLARRLIDQREYSRALSLLQAASRKESPSKNLAALLMFQQGVCRYRLNESRAAATIFAKIARDHPDCTKADRAVTFAFRLWSQLAEESRRREDYLSLADVALNLLQTFPEHDQRAEALWRLPAALQAAGQYSAASEHFGAVPADSPHYQEALYRRVSCLRLALESERDATPESEFRLRALAAARELRQYSENARKAAAPNRIPGETPTSNRSKLGDETAADLHAWSAAALISAAEILQSDGVNENQRALDLMVDFELLYTDCAEMGRVLAVRINALRALERYDDASKAVKQFLTSATEEQAGGTLAVIAKGMRQEVRRLESRQKHADAERVADQSIPIFEQLEAWALAETERAKYLNAVRFGLANMCFVAGKYDAARSAVAKLLADEPDNGGYRRLNALILTHHAEDAMIPALLDEACAAWERILGDPGLRTKTPDRYWEARYYYLELLLMAGRATEVENAIRQDRVWYPDRDPSKWDDKINDLYDRASDQLD